MLSQSRMAASASAIGSTGNGENGPPETAEGDRDTKADTSATCGGIGGPAPGPGMNPGPLYESW